MADNITALGLELVGVEQLATELLSRAGGGMILLAGLPPGSGPMVPLAPGQMPVLTMHKGHPVALLKLVNQFNTQILGTLRVQAPPPPA